MILALLDITKFIGSCYKSSWYAFFSSTTPWIRYSMKFSFWPLLMQPKDINFNIILLKKYYNTELTKSLHLLYNKIKTLCKSHAVRKRHTTSWRPCTITPGICLIFSTLSRIWLGFWNHPPLTKNWLYHKK